ncbi:hypothetical protein ACQCN2_14645 [Brevibacillus ginsengisoli]|uniref:hypothetical protein n=1 Tax=Brevibacillus ginsengisoli TaxID=363854 RepID=UPI003CF4026B
MKAGFSLIALLLLLFSGMPTNLQEPVNQKAKTEVTAVLNNQLGKRPLDFQQMDWSPEGWNKIQSLMDHLIPTLELIREANPISYDQLEHYIAVSYSDLTILIPEDPAKNIVLIYNQQFYLCRGGEKEINEIIKWIKSQMYMGNNQ